MPTEDHLREVLVTYMHERGRMTRRGKSYRTRRSRVREGLLAIAGLLFSAGNAWAQPADELALTGPISSDIDALWVMIAAVLVFLMQPGFLMFEVGFVRPKNTLITAFKNVGDWLIVSIIFTLVGFGLMFGLTQAGWIGLSIVPDGFSPGTDPYFWVFVIFQLAFAGTASTIISGAMAERTSFIAYLLIALFMAALIYPVFGHWVWGNLYFGGDNEGWLFALGFRDFAGSAVVHGTGAWAALAGVAIVGPRLGRYTREGVRAELGTNSVMWACFGTFLLWAGWFGFNGGSTLFFASDSNSAASVIVITNIAAATAGVIGVAHCILMQSSRDLAAKTLGSVLGGLVAITACADNVTIWSAVLIGGVAAIVHNYTFELVLDRWKLDDVVGAIPVHGFCGVWGLLATAIFAVQLPGESSRLYYVGIQALGAAVNFAWAAGTSSLLFLALKKLSALRVANMSEIQGLTLDGLMRPATSALDQSAEALLDAVDRESETRTTYL